MSSIQMDTSDNEIRILSKERLQSILTKVQALDHYKHYINELISNFEKNNENFDEVYKAVVPQLLKLKLKTKSVLKAIDFLIDVAVKAENELTEYILDIHSDLTYASEPLIRQRSVYIIMRILNSMPDNYTLTEDIYKKINKSLVERLQDTQSNVRTYAVLALKRFETSQLVNCLLDPRAQVVVATLQSIAINSETIIPIIRLVGDSRSIVREYAYQTIKNIPIEHITHTSLCYIFIHALTEERPTVKKQFEELVKYWIETIEFEEYFEKYFPLDKIPQLPPQEGESGTDMERYILLSKKIVEEFIRITQSPAGVTLDVSPTLVILRCYVLLSHCEGDYPDGQEVLNCINGKSELEQIALMKLYSKCNGGKCNILEVVRGRSQVVVEEAFRVLIKMEPNDHFGIIVNEMHNITEDDQPLFLKGYYKSCIEVNYILPSEFLEYHLRQTFKNLQSPNEEKRMFTMEFVGLTVLVNKEKAQQFIPVLIAGLSKDTTPVRLVALKGLTDYYLLSGINVPETLRDIYNDALLSLSEDLEALIIVLQGVIRLYLNDRLHISEESSELCLAKTMMSLFIRSIPETQLRSLLFTFFLCYSQSHFEDSKKLYELCLDEAGPELEKITEVFIPMLSQYDKEINTTIMEMCMHRLMSWIKAEDNYSDEMIINLTSVFYKLDYTNNTTDIRDISIQRLKSIQSERNSNEVNLAIKSLIEAFEELNN
ncbi:HEAT repeat domain containing protein [Entamoeba histolytica HM-1:IMSS-B]|nr:HEAT repeat domain containing protein [Entamoeba histolytica KU27]EMH75775.1 HEAT repeat domain containing protein [Entamoeba histolytica HM-1:IMSS-B]EMS11035.1 HEAT repeat domain containing protein [Entamoeba histolytica HM-3:IMSS]GAT94680.1 heat repeat domain containing protein [Entamoeba histolytica]